MIDAVYLVGKKPDVPDYWELKMSIRSLEKNFKDLRNIFIVGQLPNWCQGVTHIPHEDPYRRNKDANLIQKIITACTQPDLSNEFIRFSDDQFVLKPCTIEDVRPPKYNDKMLNNSKSKWMRRAQNTVKVLKKRNLPTHIYECHCPYVLDKQLYPRTVLQFDYGNGGGYLVNTIYFNSIRTAIGHTKDTTCSANRSAKPKDLDVVCSGKLFLNINHGYNEEMIQWMENRFPDKSKYEK